VSGTSRYSKAELAVLRQAREIVAPKGTKIKKPEPAKSRRLAEQRKERAKRGHRKCHGKNIYGEPCGAAPLRKGTEIEGIIVDGNWCLKHDPSVPDGAWNRFVQEPGSNALRNKPKVRRPLELLGEAIVKAPGLLMQPYLEALGLAWNEETEELVKVGDGAKIVGFSREGYARVSKHKDLEAQQRAAERMLDRVFGKPRQAVDVGAGGNGMVGIVIPQTAERARVVLDVLQESGALQLPNGNGNGNHAEETITDADIVEE